MTGEFKRTPCCAPGQMEQSERKHPSEPRRLPHKSRALKPVSRSGRDRASVQTLTSRVPAWPSGGLHREGTRFVGLGLVGEVTELPATARVPFHQTSGASVTRRLMAS